MKQVRQACFTQSNFKFSTHCCDVLEAQSRPAGNADQVGLRFLILAFFPPPTGRATHDCVPILMQQDPNIQADSTSSLLSTLVEYSSRTGHTEKRSACVSQDPVLPVKPETFHSLLNPSGVGFACMHQHASKYNTCSKACWQRRVSAAHGTSLGATAGHAANAAPV